MMQVALVTIATTLGFALVLQVRSLTLRKKAFRDLTVIAAARSGAACFQWPADREHLTGFAAARKLDARRRGHVEPGE